MCVGTKVVIALAEVATVTVVNRCVPDFDRSRPIRTVPHLGRAGPMLLELDLVSDATQTLMRPCPLLAIVENTLLDESSGTLITLFVSRMNSMIESSGAQLRKAIGWNLDAGHHIDSPWKLNSGVWTRLLASRIMNQTSIFREDHS